MFPSSIAYPPNQTHVFFEITDPDGLYQMRFLHHQALMLGCKDLNGEKEIVRLSANSAINKSVLVEAVDVNGHMIYGPWHSLKDLKPNLILDISGDVRDVPDYNYIHGPWLWMIAPTEQNQGGSPSTDIDSLAVASENTVDEKKVSKYGTTEGEMVGDYTWTVKKIQVLFNIGMNAKKYSKNGTEVNSVKGETGPLNFACPRSFFKSEMYSR